MDSKLEKLKKQAEKLGIELDANETIADLEAKISVAKHGGLNKVPILEDGAGLLRKGEVSIPRRQPVKRINFTRRIDREAKENG
jgi:hypothetical protein